MHHCYSATFFLLVCSSFRFSVQQTGEFSEGDQCRTPRRESGTCIKVENCEFVRKIFQTFGTNNREVNNYINKLTCGFVGVTPLVCCPGASANSNSQTTSRPFSTIGTTTLTQSAVTENALNGNTDFLKPPNCGTSTFSDYRIVGGIPAKLGNFPWMTTLGYRNNKNPNLPKWLCGGSLISTKHVLTAAHCVQTTEDLYIVRIGDLDLYSDDDNAQPVDILVQSAKVHEDYNPRISYTNDIAILNLEREVNNPSLTPACLPVDEPLRRSSFVEKHSFVAGWGSREFKGPASTSLQVTNLMVVDNRECAQNLSQFNKVRIDDSTICAGFRQGGKDACNGDSGGPLMYGITEGRKIRFFQIGIVSYGHNCALPGYPGVYTRITHYLNWIRKNL